MLKLETHNANAKEEVYKEFLAYIKFYVQDRTEGKNLRERCMDLERLLDIPVACTTLVQFLQLHSYPKARCCGPWSFITDWLCRQMPLLKSRVDEHFQLIKMALTQVLGLDESLLAIFQRQLQLCKQFRSIDVLNACISAIAGSISVGTFNVACMQAFQRRETSGEAKRAARRMGRGRERTPAATLGFFSSLAAP